MDEELLIRQACRTGGVLTARRAMELGCSAGQLRHLVRGRGWGRPLSGALAAPGHDSSPQIQRLWALRLLHPDLVISHRTAARLRGVELLNALASPLAPPEPLHLIDPLPSAGHVRHPGILVHRTLLPPDDIADLRGLRVTSAQRTLADLLRGEDRNTAVAALDSALRQGACALDGLADHLATTPVRRGKRTAWSVFALADARAESVLETQARLVMHDAGLHPRSQAPVRTARGRRRLDFLFVREGLAIETDGAASHWTPSGQRRDLRRFNELATCPEVRAVLRFTWDDVFLRPGAMLAAIRGQLARLRERAGDGWG